MNVILDHIGVVILATLAHSQSESRISNTWSLSTNQKAGFNYPRKVASYQGVRHVRHHEKSPNIPPSCNSTPNVTFQLILFWRHSLFYKRDVCDLLLTSRPFRFKKFKKSSKKWPGKRWFGGHRRYWLESSCLVGAESDQSGGLGSQVRILSGTVFLLTNLIKYLHFVRRTLLTLGIQKDNWFG